MARSHTRQKQVADRTYTPKPREQFHMLFSDEERDKLDRLARSENRSRADMVRQLILRAPG
jgi:hypothetical protein